MTRMTGDFLQTCTYAVHAMRLVDGIPEEHFVLTLLVSA